MPTKASGCQAMTRRASSRRSLNSRGRWATTSVRPMTLSSSRSNQASTPAERMPSPATPASSISGRRRRNCAARLAPRASPEASPATRTIRGARSLMTAASAQQAALAAFDRLDHQLQFRLLGGARAQLGNRLRARYALAVDQAIGLADVADLGAVVSAALEPLGVDAPRSRWLAGNHDVGRHILADAAVHAQKGV